MSEEEILAAIKEWFENTDMPRESQWVEFDDPAYVYLDGHFDLKALAKVLAEKCEKVAA